MLDLKVFWLRSTDYALQIITLQIFIKPLLYNNEIALAFYLVYLPTSVAKLWKSSHMQHN